MKNYTKLRELDFWTRLKCEFVGWHEWKYTIVIHGRASLGHDIHIGHCIHCGEHTKKYLK